ncbi:MULTISPECIES: hypothetical protein [Bradyrhizobium]|uniref:hypothetical protein n=1 Tax=Bradyrhizobium TaxID=374 RepID=UPI00042A9203|nr:MULTISPECIES: hypothetical protein [Bradyrhizobium]MCP1747118.1 hypothetical protein [Bradyrhizobium japonicum]MCP1865624.1 hypothetical protein [Bradyrhizobium japonicum]MCP1895605.1 hypothetical protein [Bradyrhizobium japonicum]MCW2328988.1 hypothetical protein [Bradyrhizobium japonicum]
MPRFIVRFIKDVLGDNGQMRSLSNDNRAGCPKRREAEQQAKERFCYIHATHDLSLHADRLKVDPADFPS